MGNPVIHFEIGSTDVETTRRFYTDLFSWNVSVDDDGYGLVSTGSAEGIGGGIMPAPEGAGSWVSFYVQVDELEKYLDRAVELGGSRLMGPTPIGERGSFAMFRDPDGNLLGLFVAA
jgi:predicted enzyme related to lactoylglutathione lyase